MRNKLIYLFGGFFVFLTVAMTFNMLGDISKTAEKKEKQLVEEESIGGETDEHGCLTSAGYSWCEEKDKCLRVWEEGCDRITTLLADLNNATSETFSSLSDATFDWRGGSGGEVFNRINGFSKTAVAVTSEMNYEVDHFFESNGYAADQYNLLDKTLPAQGYQKGDVVCLVSSKKTDRNNPEAKGKRNPYDFIVKCGELVEK